MEFNMNELLEVLEKVDINDRSSNSSITNTNNVNPSLNNSRQIINLGDNEHVFELRKRLKDAAFELTPNSMSIFQIIKDTYQYGNAEESMYLSTVLSDEEEFFPFMKEIMVNLTKQTEILRDVDMLNDEFVLMHENISICFGRLSLSKFGNQMICADYLNFTFCILRKLNWYEDKHHDIIENTMNTLINLALDNGNEITIMFPHLGRFFSSIYQRKNSTGSHTKAHKDYIARKIILFLRYLSSSTEERRFLLVLLPSILPLILDTIQTLDFYFLKSCSEDMMLRNPIYTQISRLLYLLATTGNEDGLVIEEILEETDITMLTTTIGVHLQHIAFNRWYQSSNLIFADAIISNNVCSNIYVFCQLVATNTHLTTSNIITLCSNDIMEFLEELLPKVNNDMKQKLKSLICSLK